MMVPYPNMYMYGRAATPAASEESVIPLSLKYLWVELVSLWTCDDWNITAALILTLLTDFAGILLCILEPIFSNCLGFYDSLSLNNLVSFYVIGQALGFSFLFVVCTHMERYHTQIALLWIHALNVVLLLPFLIQSMITCYPDTEMSRPLKYNKMYSGLEVDQEICSNSSPNCYRRYFDAVIIVMTASVFVGIWHSLHLGFLVWERKSKEQPHSPTQATGASPSTEEENHSDVNSIPPDDSVWIDSWEHKMRSQNNMNIISAIYFMALAIATSTLLLCIVFPNEIGITVANAQARQNMAVGNMWKWLDTNDN